ncbi:glycoside hydrolase family 20 zincin-like fold domain-containing protein, partial [Streptomyces sp. T-3]|nr:glycoside hydrolase family 20 zincin-like fold domain-containing protein [Streptomyces sp. T-3]
MQVRRRKGAAAIAAAVISGLLGSAPGALAAPSDPGISSPDAQDPQSDSPLPPVWPKPQSMRAAGGAVPVGDEVFLLTDEGADPYAVEALRKVLRSAGARMVSEVPSADALPSKGLLVRAGTDGGASRSGADAALRAL